MCRLHNLDVLVLEATNEFGGQLNLFKDKPIYDLPAHNNVNGEVIKKAFFKQINKNNSEYIKFNQDVVSVKGVFNNFEIKTKNDIFKTKTLIVATGGGKFAPIKLNLDKESSIRNLSYFVDDAKRYVGKKLIIMGGGDTAVDWANYFCEKGCNVTLVHRREKFRGQELLIEKMKNKVNILTPYKAVDFIGENKITSIKFINLKNEKEIVVKCDELLVFFGQKKANNKEVFQILNRDENGILVKSNMETSVKGVFAIGNVSSYFGKVRIMTTALGEAATAVGSVLSLIKNGKIMSYYVKKKEN